MYESYYGFTRKPFSLMPEPAFLFMTEQHKQALTVLEYGLSNQVGFIILTGEIGAGKTTLAHYLLNDIDDSFTVGFIRQTHQSFGSLMEWVGMAFGLKFGESPHEMLADFTTFLVEEYAAGKRVLLILDEAQNLSGEQLEQLRLLSNINADQDFVMQIMLLGQPGLRDLLREPSLEQFAQRIAASFHLGGMSRQETQGYIHHRILAAGSRDTIFTPDACAVIHRIGKGLPRLINLICDTALVYGYGAGAPRIDAALVSDFIDAHLPYLLVPIESAKEALGDRQQNPQPLPRQIAPVSPPAAKVSTTRVVHIDTSTRLKPPAQLKPALQQKPFMQGRADTGQERILHAAHPAHVAGLAVRATPIAEARREYESVHIHRPSEPAEETLRIQPSTLEPMSAPVVATATEEAIATARGIETTAPSVQAAPAFDMPSESAASQSDEQEPRPLAWQRILGTSLILILLGLGIFMGTLPGTGGERATRAQDAAADRAAVSSSQAVGEGGPSGTPKTPEAMGPAMPAPGAEAPASADIQATVAPLVGARTDPDQPPPENAARDTEPIVPVRPTDPEMDARDGAENRFSAGHASQDAAILTESAPRQGTDHSVSTASPRDETLPTPSQPSPTHQDLTRANLGASIGAGDAEPHRAASRSTPEATGPSEAPERRPPSEPAPEAAQQRPLAATLGAALSASERTAERSSPSAIEAPPNAPAEPPQSGASSMTRALEQRLSPLAERIRGSGANQLNIDLGRFVLFPAGSAELNGRARETLFGISNVLGDYEAVRVRVIAYTDSPGSTALNLKLSQERAARVSSFLADAGIASTRLEHEGRGESETRATPKDDSDSGVWTNRRIELELTLPDETSPAAAPSPDRA